MPNQKLLENWQWIVLWVILLLSAIYSRPPIPIDETRYLSVAWEMWNSNEFLVPHINGQPYSHKPPLFFWLIHLSWFIFGVGEWSGRIVGPLFGFGSILLTIRLAKSLWPTQNEISLAVPFILLGTFVWSIFSTLTMFDTLLTCCTLSGLLSILGASKKKSLLPWVGLSASIGLGILAKGPIILLYVLPPLLLMPYWCEDKRHTLVRWYSLSLLFLGLGVGIALCWAIPAALTGGEVYKEAILYGQTAGRMVQSFAHKRPFYWYLLLTPFICLPWIFWLPAWRSWAGKRMDSSVRFCLSGLLPSLFFLSLVSGKQLHYILPLLPFVSLLLGWAVTSTAEQPQSPLRDSFPLLLVFLVLTVALFIIPLFTWEGGDRELLVHIPKWLTIVPLLGGATILFVRSQRVVGNIKIVSACSLLMVASLQLFLAAPLHQIYDQTDIALAIKKIQTQGGAVAVIPGHQSDQFQFSGRLDTPLVPQVSLHNLAKWAESNPGQYCLIFSKLKLQNSVKAIPYKNGWANILPARNYLVNYRLMIQSKQHLGSD